jgi:tetratricopeptide (TPR) repeat protein
MLFAMAKWLAAGEHQLAAPSPPPNDRQMGAVVRPEAEPPGLGQLHRDFGFPGAIRAWERGLYLNPPHRGYGRRYPSVYGPRYGYYAGRYGHYRPYYDRYGNNRLYRESFDGSNYGSYSLRLDHAYDLGVAPREIQERIAAQAERALTNYQDVMNAGHDAFSGGHYGQAARYFLLASQLNHGDPSSRLCAAHAQTALGQYQSAAGLVHRAFDLQPKLAYLPLDIRDAYGPASDFADHLAGLREAVEAAGDPDLWFLLGYYYHNSGELDLAASALAQARQLNPNDRIITRFAEVARHVSP